MYKEDIELAKKARLNACAPYSNFQVGAALRTKNGKYILVVTSKTMVYSRSVLSVLLL